MEEAEIMPELVKTIRFTFGTPPDLAVSRETTAYDIDGWDSLSHATLMIMVEKKFGVHISEAESNDMANVGDLHDAICAKIFRGPV